MMLPAGHRIRKSKEFSEVFRKGARVGSKKFVIHYFLDHQDAGLSQNMEDDVKVGFVVPKTIGNAVTRNLVKRRLRSFFRPIVKNFPAGARVVVRALPGSQQINFVQITIEIEKLIGRLEKELEKKPGKSLRGTNIKEKKVEKKFSCDTGIDSCSLITVPGHD